MNLEFHYYTICFLAKNAGFSEYDATTIAHSSQFVDHNIVSYRIETQRGEYRLTPTQNYGFWDESFPRTVYVPFHFFPGDPDEPRAKRRDGAVNPFNTTPNSPRVKELLVEALRSRNLYRVGIALHTYADSWAHQNFSGRLEEWNRIERSTPVPAIGHAQALGRPDDLALTWEDPRLAPDHATVVNRTRFFRAARQIYKYLSTYLGKKYDDLELVEWELERIVGTQERRLSTTERINEYIISQECPPYSRSRWLTEALDLPPRENEELMFRGYSKVLWLRDAVLYRSRLLEQRPVRALDGFYTSDLYRWHEAAKEHLAAAEALLSDLTWR